MNEPRRGREGGLANRSRCEGGDVESVSDGGDRNGPMAVPSDLDRGVSIGSSASPSSSSNCESESISAVGARDGDGPSVSVIALDASEATTTESRSCLA